MIIELALMAWGMQATAAAPQRQPQAAIAPAASFDRESHWAMLDARLAQKDYGALQQVAQGAASADEFIATLDWLGAQFSEGSLPFVAFMYSQMLQAYADALPADKAPQIKSTALAAMLYAVTSAMIDGRQCADVSAQSNRAEQFAGMLSSSELMKLESKDRAVAAMVAMELEKRGWAGRKSQDDTKFLCANGMTAMTAGLLAGQSKEVAPTEGQIGRQFAVTVPDSFKHERVKDEVWWAKAEEFRMQLPQILKSLARVEEIPKIEDL